MISIILKGIENWADYDNSSDLSSILYASINPQNYH